VLSQMLEPRVRPKGLDEATFLGRILEHALVVGAIAPARSCVSAERV
jgi:hypothetical protein